MPYQPSRVGIAAVVPRKDKTPTLLARLAALQDGFKPVVPCDWFETYSF